MVEQNSESQSPSAANYVFRLHQVLFAFAFSFSITAVILAFVYQRAFGNHIDTEPSTYFTYWYFFLRTGVRFNTFFSQEPQNLFGMTLTFLTIVSGIAMLLAFIFRGVARTRF